MRMQRNEESTSFLDQSISSYTPPTKRQQSVSSLAREHGNKLLCLSVGKAKSLGGRKKQDQHSILSTSLNQALKKSNNRLDKVHTLNFKPLSNGFSKKKESSVSELDIKKLNSPSSAHFRLASANMISTSSLGKWKLASKEAQAKTSIKRKIFTTRKSTPPTWVERMSKAKNVFSNLLRPLLLAHFKNKPPLEAAAHERILQPPRLMAKSSITSKKFRKHITGGRAFSLMQLNLPRICCKKSIAPIQYDISTGRKIVDSKQDCGKLIRVENQHICPNFKSFHEKNIRLTRGPFIKHGIMPSTMANLGGDHVQIRGWNADPFIKSDIPYKPTDIIRYNRNGGLNVKIRRGDAHSKHRSSTSTSIGQMKIRHVTFAGMVIHNSRNEKTRKNLIAPQSIDSLHTHVASKKASTSKLIRVLRKCHNSSPTKMPPVQDKLHKYRSGGKKWTYHEGFWTKMFQSELEKVSEDNLLQNLLTPRSMSQPTTPILELTDAQVIENDAVHKHVERVRAKDFLTVESSLLVKRMDDEDVMGIAHEKNSWVENAQSFQTNYELRNGFDVQNSDVFIEGDRKYENLDLLKNLDFFSSDGIENGTIIDHHSIVATNEEDEQAKSCCEMKSTIIGEMPAQAKMTEYHHHVSD